MWNYLYQKDIDKRRKKPKDENTERTIQYTPTQGGLRKNKNKNQVSKQRSIQYTCSTISLLNEQE
jgi:hypothetical protein